MIQFLTGVAYSFTSVIIKQASRLLCKCVRAGDRSLCSCTFPFIEITGISTTIIVASPVGKLRVEKSPISYAVGTRRSHVTKYVIQCSRASEYKVSQPSVNEICKTMTIVKCDIFTVKTGEDKTRSPTPWSTLWTTQMEYPKNTILNEYC